MLNKYLGLGVLVTSFSAYFLACATLPVENHKHFSFPESAFIDEPKRPYEVLGPVRSKVNYPTLQADQESSTLCRNYYNKAVGKLVEYAKKAGGDAVIDVKSVVVMMDGKAKSYPKAECFDDGSEGQVLTRGIAIRWLDKNLE